MITLTVTASQARVERLSETVPTGFGSTDTVTIAQANSRNASAVDSPARFPLGPGADHLAARAFLSGSLRSIGQFHLADVDRAVEGPRRGGLAASRGPLHPAASILVPAVGSGRRMPRTSSRKCSRPSRRASRISDATARGDSFRGWLRGIARNKTLDLLRRRGARGQGGTDSYQRSLLIPDPDDGNLDPGETEVIGVLFQEALKLVHGEFEERTWRAFWQTVVAGQATANVAQELGVTSAAVRQAKSRILRRLKDVLGEPACPPER